MDQGRWPRRGRMFLFVFVALVAALGIAACGDDVPEPTIEERLEAAEGRTLTDAEISQKLGVGDALCKLDDPVLDAVWQRLSEDQLVFQDFVFGYVCPERSVFYAGLTGRYVTEEAEDSGVVPSTTRPPATSAPGLPTGPGGRQLTTTAPATGGQAPPLGSIGPSDDPATTDANPGPNATDTAGDS